MSDSQASSSGGAAQGPTQRAMNAGAVPDVTAPAPPRVLVVHGDHAIRSELAGAIRPSVLQSEATGTLTDARMLLDTNPYDLVLISDELPDGPGFELANELTAMGLPMCALIIATNPGLEGATAAFASGAIDYVAWPCEDADMQARILRAAGVVRRERDRETRIQQLREACRSLNGAREEMTEHVNSLCDDLVNAYEDLADQMDNVTLATEFRSLVQQELDVEALLRTTLEYMLTKTGPTNAAVFLPTGTCDYSLGAYINYDIPKDTVDMLLDHLADTLAPQLAPTEGLITCRTEADLKRWIGDDTMWLGDSELISLTQFYKGEPLAVITLFRDRRHPFSDEVISNFTTMAEIFGEQLACVVRVHHRHLPDADWPGFDFEGGDEDEYEF